MKHYIRWGWDMSKKCWELRDFSFMPKGELYATVYPNCVWWTWDADGTGGENSKESSIIAAMRECEIRCVMQGFIDFNIKPHITTELI